MDDQTNSGSDSDNEHDNCIAMLRLNAEGLSPSLFKWLPGHVAESILHQTALYTLLEHHNCPLCEKEDDKKEETFETGTPLTYQRVREVQKRARYVVFKLSPTEAAKCIVHDGGVCNTLSCDWCREEHERATG